MSKAFTKEEPQLEDDDLEPAAPPIPEGAKNYMTPKGNERLRAEVKELLDVKRPEITAVVQWAASNGDRSENADYIYGKKRLREIDRRIRFLQKRLENAEIIDPASQTGDKVRFGATVTVRDESGASKTFAIVGIDETEVKRGRISWISPMGRALLNAKPGDTVTVRMPKGEEDIEILSVEFKSLEE